MLAVRQLGAQRLGEAGEVFVERKEPEQFGRGRAVGGGFAVRLFGGFFIVRYAFGVEVADFKEVEGDAAVRRGRGEGVCVSEVVIASGGAWKGGKGG